MKFSLLGALGAFTALAFAGEPLTSETGQRTATNQDTLVATEDGGILVKDTYSFEKCAHFDWTPG